MVNTTVGTPGATKMLEKELERKCAKVAKSAGAIFWKFQSPGTNGVPDRIMILPNGKVIFIEFKVGKNKLSKLQAAIIEKIRKNHGSVWLIRDADVFKDFLHEAL